MTSENNIVIKLTQQEIDDIAKEIYRYKLNFGCVELFFLRGFVQNFVKILRKNNSAFDIIDFMRRCGI